MDRKEMLRMDTVYIPSNYTDAGKLLGAFALRQVAECAAICLPLAAMVFLLCPLGLTGKSLSAPCWSCRPADLPCSAYRITAYSPLSVFTAAGGKTGGY